MDALDQCIDFLGCIFEPEDVIEFRPLPPSAGRRWSTLAELPDIVEWLHGLNTEQLRVHAYFGANPRKAKGQSHRSPADLRRRARKAPSSRLLRSRTRVRSTWNSQGR